MQEGAEEKAARAARLLALLPCVIRPRARLNDRGRSEGAFGFMGFDRGRRGRGRDKRDGFGEEGFDPFGGGGGGAAAPAAGAAPPI